MPVFTAAGLGIMAVQLLDKWATAERQLYERSIWL